MHDLYSAHVTGFDYKTPFTYDYLASPANWHPVKRALPEVSADGLTYTIRVKKGIYFADDPAFKGKKRELTAADYAYTFKRLLDPTLRSPNSWLLDGRIVGMEALQKKAQKTGKFDYDQPVAGLQMPDRYTLVIRLTSPDQNF